MENGLTLCKIALMDVGCLIKEKLEPTLAELGFRRAPDSSERWRYEGKHFVLLVYIDPRGELGLHITSPRGEPPIELWRFLGQSDPDWAFAGTIMYSDSNRLAESLERLSGLLARNANLLNIPDDLIISRLRKIQDEESEMHWQRIKLETALRQAENMWKTKRYREFSDLLGPWEAMLTPATKAKLQYSLRHLT